MHSHKKAQETQTRSQKPLCFFVARILIVLAATTSAFAQPRCEVGVQAPPVGFWTWAAGTPIVVPKP